MNIGNIQKSTEAVGIFIIQLTQLTGFYMKATLALNGLRVSKPSAFCFKINSSVQYEYENGVNREQKYSYEIFLDHYT